MDKETIYSRRSTERRDAITLYLTKYLVGSELFMVEDKDCSTCKPLSVELPPYSLTPAGVSHGEMDAVFAEVVPINSCGEVSQSVEEVMRHHLRFAAGA